MSLKLEKGSVLFVDVINHNILRSEWIKAPFLEKTAKSKLGQSTLMSDSAWCDLNSKEDSLKMHELCQKPKCIFQ